MKQVRATCRDQMVRPFAALKSSTRCHVNIAPAQAHLYELTRPLEQSLDNIFNLEAKRNVRRSCALSAPHSSPTLAHVRSLVTFTFSSYLLTTLYVQEKRNSRAGLNAAGAGAPAAKRARLDNT
jgi:hypothetical protein